MVHLKSLQKQLEALRIVVDNAIAQRKPAEEIHEIQQQIKKVEKLIYERKVMLKRDGLYKEE